MEFYEALLAWYRGHRRELPWRGSRDPYAVLVSEMMLQQTRVETAVDYYTAFMRRFPDAAALARADEAQVLSCWQGLGYYGRARRLHETAKRVAARGGAFPDTYDELRALPGIGPYIAGAVMSIAYDQPCPAVDGNVLRVMSRFFGLRGDISRAPVREDIEARVRQLMPPRHAGDFSQALMELGALVCRPSGADCEACPVAADCAALRENAVQEIPVKKAKAKVRTERLSAAVVHTPKAVLMQYRREETLLAGMWGLPVFEERENLVQRMCEKHHIHLAPGCHIGHVSHVFTHRRWEVDVVSFALPKRAAAGELEWVDWEQIDCKPIPTAFKKILDIVSKERRRT